MIITSLLFAFQLAAEPLPTATGPYRTGRTTFHWVDRTREELETRAPNDRREVVVYLFYPAEPNEKAARAPYMPDAEAMRGLWSDAQVDRLKGMRAHARENAALIRGAGRFPVVLLSPGGGMKVVTYHTLAEDLASHGYVVAAIDPPYNARAMGLPNGRKLGPLSPAERGWPETRNQEDEIKNYQARVAHWARDMSFVIDQLKALDAGKGAFARRLDFSRGVGALGHSRGGQAAGAVRVLEPRICGGVNMDGVQGPYAIQAVKGDDNGKQPFMWLMKPLPRPNEEQLKRAGRTMAQFDSVMKPILVAWDRQLGSITGGALRVVVDRPGIEHIDFSDEQFWDAAMTTERRAEKTRTIAETRQWVRAFMDGCTRGNWTALRALVAEAGKSAPHITVTAYGAFVR